MRGQTAVTYGRSPVDTVQYFDDFIAGGYVPDAALANESDPAAKFSEVANAGEWLVTVVDGGKDGNNTIAVSDDLPNGYLAITNTAADNDATSMQLNGESFKLQAGKRLVFEAKFRITDVSETDFFIGLAISDTAIMGATLADGCTDLIGFGCPDSTGDLDYIASKDSGGTSVDTGVNLADATDVVVRIEIEGTSRAKFFVNDVLIATVTEGLPDDEALTPTIEVRNDGGAAQSILVDYILVEGDR